MSITRLAPDRWRAQCHVPRKGNVDVSKIAPHLYPTSVFPTRREAVAAKAEARKHLGRRRSGVTVREFRDRWLTDPVFTRQRPKQSTLMTYRSLTNAFVDEYGDHRMADIDHDVVSDWLAAGHSIGHAKVLSSMFADAASPKAGKIVAQNPWAKLGLSRGPGRRDVDPPSEKRLLEIIGVARELSGPYVAAWLTVAAYTGMRPAEVDAMRWLHVDLDRRRYLVAEQFGYKSRTFTPPKNGKRRTIVLLPPAVEALGSVERCSEFCFVNLFGEHWRRQGFNKHWYRIRREAGFDGDLYVATRHFFGSYATNVLRMDAEDVALQLGHTDGGKLVRELYGHRSRDEALNRLEAAFDARSNVVGIDHARRTA